MLCIYLFKDINHEFRYPYYAYKSRRSCIIYQVRLYNMVRETRVIVASCYVITLRMFIIFPAKLEKPIRSIHAQ